MFPDLPAFPSHFLIPPSLMASRMPPVTPSPSVPRRLHAQIHRSLHNSCRASLTGISNLSAAAGTPPIASPDQGATPRWAKSFGVTLDPSAPPPTSSTSASSTLMCQTTTPCPLPTPRSAPWPKPPPCLHVLPAGIFLRPAQKLQASSTSLHPATSAVHAQGQGRVSCPGISIV